MGKMYDEDEEADEAMTSAQAKRLVEWLMKNGYSKQEADKALMYVMTGIESE